MKKFKKSDRNSSRYLEWLVSLMVDTKDRNNPKDEFIAFLYDIYYEIYAACHDDDVIAFRCNKNVYEIGQFNIIFTFVAGVWLDEGNPNNKIFVPIHKPQSTGTPAK